MPRDFDLTKIVVGNRQREEIGDLNEMVASLSKHGQLQPILIDQNNNLIAGFRRLSTLVLMGLKTGWVEYRETLSDIDSAELELEENVRRKQLTWQEESKAIEKIHALYMKKDPNWTREKTGELVGVSTRKVAMSLELSKAIEAHPEVAKADTQQGAMMRLSTIRQIDQRKADVQVRAKAEELGMIAKTTAKIVGPGPALEAMQAIDTESFDMVVSNPPYGVDIESVFKGDRTIYEDAEKDIVPMLQALCKEVFRVLKNDRWFIWFYPTARLEEGSAMLADAGFSFQSVPCIWYKPNKFLSSLSDPYKLFSSQYETFFWARKGAPKFNRLRTGNVFVYDTPDHADRIHPLQMPVDLWKEILEIGSVEGETILEPFSGSGSCGVASVELARNYVGLELSPEYVERSRMLIAEAQTRPVMPVTDAKIARATQEQVNLKDAFAALSFRS